VQDLVALQVAALLGKIFDMQRDVQGNRAQTAERAHQILQYVR